MAGWMDTLRPDDSGATVRTVGALLAVIFGVAPHLLDAYYTEVVFLAMIYLILAISWNLIAGYTGQIMLGLAGFFGLGGFISAWLTSPAGAGLPGWLQVPGVVAILVAGVAMAVFALLLGPAFFRLRGHYFAIGTLAFGEILRVIMENARQFSGGATGYYITVEHPIRRYYYTVVFLLVTLFAVYYLLTAKSGLGMRAVKGDEAAANSLGVHPLRYKLFAFVVSAFLAGVAGGLYAQFTGYINPSSTLAISWTVGALIIVVLGAQGTVLGPFFGIIPFMILDTLLVNVVGVLATGVEGVILILVILFLPNGILGYVTANTRFDLFAELHEFEE